MGITSSQLRAGHPDFLDLPWDQPLEAWGEHCNRLVELPRGESRHTVQFVGYDRGVYALKSMAPETAGREYRLLREMHEHDLPVVEAVGYLRATHGGGEHSVLITRYLDYSLPYHALFLRSDLSRYREHLLDAMAGLLVQLHLAGVFWGDCSLYNTLFLRDAGRLQAVLVDAETSEIRPSLTEALRTADLDLMEENVTGGLLDLVAAGAFSPDEDVLAVVRDIRRRYEGLWYEIRHEVMVGADASYRIEERVRALNALGFTVDEVELRASDGGERLQLRAVVTDRSFNRRLIHSLTGLEVQEHQAQQMMNEVRQLKVELSGLRGHSLALSVAAFHWLEYRYAPIIRRLRAVEPDVEPAELYCQLLEHKWFLSEHAKRDVGHEAAIEDFVARRSPPVVGAGSDGGQHGAGLQVEEAPSGSVVEELLLRAPEGDSRADGDPE